MKKQYKKKKSTRQFIGRKVSGSPLIVDRFVYLDSIGEEVNFTTAYPIEVRAIWKIQKRILKGKRSGQLEWISINEKTGRPLYSKPLYPFQMFKKPPTLRQLNEKIMHNVVLNSGKFDFSLLKGMVRIKYIEDQDRIKQMYEGETGKEMQEREKENIKELKQQMKKSGVRKKSREIKKAQQEILFKQKVSPIKAFKHRDRKYYENEVKKAEARAKALKETLKAFDKAQKVEKAKKQKLENLLKRISKQSKQIKKSKPKKRKKK